MAEWLSVAGERYCIAAEYSLPVDATCAVGHRLRLVETLAGVFIVHCAGCNSAVMVERARARGVARASARLADPLLLPSGEVLAPEG